MFASKLLQEMISMEQSVVKEGPFRLIGCSSSELNGCGGTSLAIVQLKADEDILFCEKLLRFRAIFEQNLKLLGFLVEFESSQFSL
jgi:hypothetical protein